MQPKPLTEEEKKLLEQTQKQNQAASERRGYQVQS